MFNPLLQHFHPGTELTPQALHYYSVLGRALNTAQHLEILCRGLAGMCYLLTHKGEILAPDKSAECPPDTQQEDDGIRALKGVWVEKEVSKKVIDGLNQLTKKTLGQQARELKTKELVSEDFLSLLDEATSARNTLIHYSYFDFEDQDELSIKNKHEAIIPLVRSIAAADKWIAAFLTILNGDPLPGKDYFDNYEDRVVEWVSAPTFRH